MGLGSGCICKRRTGLTGGSVLSNAKSLTFIPWLAKMAACTCCESRLTFFLGSGIVAAAVDVDAADCVEDLRYDIILGT